MQPYPTEAEIRDALVSRVAEFCRDSGLGPRTVCIRAINDPNFFNKVKSGGNFTLRTYARVHRWLDRQKGRARPVVAAAKGSKRRNGKG
jgi:hypothetical protein